MNFTPNDLQNFEFSKSLRGYSESEVKDMIQKIIEDYSLYLHENIELRDRISLLNEGIQHYKNIEESLNNTLIIAQQTGEEIKKTSYEKAENIIKEAEVKAHKILNKANEEIMKLKYDYEEMKRGLNAFRAKSESLLKFQLESLKQVTDVEGIMVKSKDRNNENVGIKS